MTPTPAGSLKAAIEEPMYFHELIANRGGVWIGCDDRTVLEKSHTPGETGEEIKTLYAIQKEDVEAVLAERVDLLARLEAAERDAKRYRKLKNLIDADLETLSVISEFTGQCTMLTSKELDGELDSFEIAAIKGEAND